MMFGILNNWGYILSFILACTLLWIFYKRTAINLVYFKLDEVDQMILNTLNTLYENTGNINYHETIPWTIIVGPPHAGKKHIMPNADADFYVKDDAEIICSSHIYNDGVIIKVSSISIMSKELYYRQFLSSLINSLKKYRPAQPVDSITITLPYTLFTNHNNDNWFAIIRDTLTDVQKQFGFRMAVNLLITRCESMPGFQQISEHLDKSQIFGWSSPHSTANYSTDWINESINYIAPKVLILRDSILANNKSSASVVIEIDREIEHLRESWSQAMSSIFKFNAHTVLPFIRGVYLSSQYTENNKTLAGFTHNLFHNKIFLETGVSDLLEKNSFALDKFLHDTRHFIAGALVLLGTYGLAKEQMILRHNTKQLARCIKELSFKHNNLEATLDSINDAQSYPLFMFWIIYSWQSPIEIQLNRVYQEVYSKILDAAIKRLQIKIERVMNYSAGQDEQSMKLLKKDPAWTVYGILDTLVTEINNIEEQLEDLYSGNAHAFRRALVDLLPEINIPHNLQPVLSQDRYTLEDLLDKTILIHVFNNLITELTDAITNEHNVLQISLLVQKLQQLQDLPDLTSKQDLIELSECISKLISDCENEELFWLCYGKLSEDKPCRILIAKMEKSSIFSNGIETFTHQADEKIILLREKISNATRTWPIIDRIFIMKNDKLSVAPGVKDLLSLINLVLAQDFMTEQTSSKYMEWNLKYTLLWNPEILSQYIAFIKKHEHFMLATLPKLPPKLRPAIAKATAHEMLILAYSKLHTAEIIVTQQHFNQHYFLQIAQSLRSNQAMLFVILRYLKSLGFKDIVEQITSGIAFQVESAMERLRLYLDSQQLYNMNELLTCAFSKDHNYLKLLLTQSITRLETITRELATPLIEFYLDCEKICPEKIQISMAIIFWNEIITEIRNYRENHSGVLMELENSLMRNTYKSEAQAFPTTQNKYLKYKIQELQDALQRHLSHTIDAELYQLQQTLSKEYQKYMAPYFPFSQNPNAPMISAANAQSFYKGYAVHRAKIIKLLENQYATGDLAIDMKRIINKLDNAKSWLQLAPLTMTVQSNYDVELHCDQLTFNVKTQKKLHLNRHKTLSILMKDRKIDINLSNRKELLQYLMNQKKIEDILLIHTMQRVVQIKMNFYNQDNEIGWPDFSIEL